MANQNLRRTFDVTPGKKNTIVELRNSIGKGGIVRTNQFVVRLNFPPGPANRPFRAVMDAPDLLVRAQTVFMPGTNFSTVEDTNIYGPNRNKGSIEIYSMTNKGPNGVSNQDGNIPNGDVNNTGTDVPGYGLKCWEAYPITIGQVDFDAAASTAFGTINIDFGFRYTTDISRYGSDAPFNEPRADSDISQSSRNLTGGLEF